MAASACGFAALNWQALWWLALIGAVTEAAAIGGGWARRRRFAGWCAWHVRLMCGSYVSLLTALLVVNWRSPIVWVLPSLIATPLMRLLLVASEHRSKFRRMELAGGVRRAESRVAVSANR